MEDTNEFVQFDVVSDDSDHRFLGSNVRQCFTDAKSGVYRTIMREWKTLQQNLPESIYVRVYERRIDLMRAVIVGVAGTPYHDGLFFFDIAFPSDYPNHPPKVYYHSFGYRVNPNLYQNGRVCLSLLNTWYGKKREQWVPSRSTILQVLLSIQALVLNQNPYYNEPGNGTLGHRSSDIRSRFYNEDVFIITHKTSLRLLHNPPLNFEAFVSSHFRERGFRILVACNEYANGRVRVGYYSSHLHSSSSSSSSSATVRVSREFKEGMMQFYPRLVDTFGRNGAVLDGLVQDLVVDIGNSEKRLPPDKSWAFCVPFFLCLPLVTLTIFILFFVFQAAFTE